MQKYEFGGEEFRFPKKITNGRVISLMELEEESEKSWYVDRQRLPQMMELLLDGDHDSVDWLEQDSAECVKVYRDFFLYYAERMSESKT